MSSRVFAYVYGVLALAAVTLIVAFTEGLGVGLVLGVLLFGAVGLVAFNQWTAARRQRLLDRLHRELPPGTLIYSTPWRRVRVRLHGIWWRL